MKKYIVRHGCLAVAFFSVITLFTGCSGKDSETSDVITPREVVKATALEIQADIPGGDIQFEPATGQINVIRAGGVADFAAVQRIIPLAESRGNTEGELSSAMLEFFTRYKDGFHLQDPIQDLAIVRDPENDPLRAEPELPAEELGGYSSLPTQHFSRMYQGVPVYGQFAIGVFDPDGNLISMSTRLLPIPSATATNATFTQDEAFDLLASRASAYETATYDEEGNITWLPLTFDPLTSVDMEHSASLVLMPVDKSNAIDTVGEPHSYRLVYDVHFRDSLNLGRAFIDAQTGEIISVFNETPFADYWYKTSDNYMMTAPDELGNMVSVISARYTTQYDDAYFMGIAGHGFDAGWLGSSNQVTIDDVFTDADRAKFYAAPIFIEARINNGNGTVDNTWYNDTTYTGNKRCASRLMRNFQTVNEWWAQRGRLGWDGLAGDFFMAIGIKNSTGAGEDLNAWGGGGTIAVGGAKTATGQFVSSSLEVVGHEFMHSVINATSDLEYLNESGAINESLADLFGVAMTAHNDRLNNNTFGEDCGWFLRDMVNPTTYGQPDHYSNYVKTKDDAGGVHTNSGILNKAHSLLIQGGDFHGYHVPAVGMEMTTRIIRTATTLKLYPKTASMEEFANAVLGACDDVNVLGQLFGGESINSKCQAFRKAYKAVGVLPIPAWENIVISSAMQDSTKVDAVVDNMTNSMLNPTQSGSKIKITDSKGNDFYLPIADIEFENPDVKVINPGESARFRADISQELADIIGKKGDDLVKISVVLDDSTTITVVGNVLRMGSDFVPESILELNANVASVTVAKITNAGFLAYPVGLGAVVLTRSNATGALTVVPSESNVDLEGKLATSKPAASSAQIPFGGLITHTINAPLILLEKAKKIPEMPGRYQVWFNDAGGLPELNDHTQLYMFVDPRDQFPELKETNNFVCLNARAPGQSDDDTRGVIVRFPKTVPVETIFPSAYVAAAKKLRAAHQRIFTPSTVTVPTLNFRIVPKVAKK